MIDINTPLLKAYFEALNGNIPVPGGVGTVGVYEGEEPDGLQDPIYIVIGPITSSDNSTKHCTGYLPNMPVSIYGWKLKYGGDTVLFVNQVANTIFSILCPNPINTLDADGLGIIGTKCSSDTQQSIGELGGRKFCNRILIFSHYIYT